MSIPDDLEKGFSLEILHYDAIISSNFDINESKILKSYVKNLDLSNIPPLERRRLNNASKCAFSLFSHNMESSKPLFIFSSYTNEINISLDMLLSLKRDGFISPTAFSLSVLNATPAMLAIKSKNEREITAIAANLSLEYALLNAYIKLKDRDDYAVIFSYHEALFDGKVDKANPIFYMLMLYVRRVDILGVDSINTKQSVESNIKEQCEHNPSLRGSETNEAIHEEIGKADYIIKHTYNSNQKIDCNAYARNDKEIDSINQNSANTNNIESNYTKIIANLSYKKSTLNKSKQAKFMQEKIYSDLHFLEALHSLDSNPITSYIVDDNTLQWQCDLSLRL